VNRFLNRLRSKTGLFATLAALVVGALFCRLGLWQLSRADEKTQIVEQHKQASLLPPLESVKSGDEHSRLYRQVKLNGSYDSDRQFLLDNRTVAGQPGFEVISAFFLSDRDSDSDYVLVNRGWIGHNGDRQVELEPVPEGETTVAGILTRPSRGFVLGESVPDHGIDQADIKWPVVVQFIDYETIAAKLDKIPVINAVVVASERQRGNYRYNWKPVASGAQKHLGYAFQWFAMLAALVILYLYLMVFKNENE